MKINLDLYLLLFFTEDNILLQSDYQPNSYLYENGFTLVCSDPGPGSINNEYYGRNNVDYTVVDSSTNSIID